MARARRKLAGYPAEYDFEGKLFKLCRYPTKAQENRIRAKFPERIRCEIKGWHLAKGDDVVEWISQRKKMFVGQGKVGKLKDEFGHSQ